MAPTKNDKDECESSLTQKPRAQNVRNTRQSRSVSTIDDNKLSMSVNMRGAEVKGAEFRSSSRK